MPFAAQVVIFSSISSMILVALCALFNRAAMGGSSEYAIFNLGRSSDVEMPWVVLVWGYFSTLITLIRLILSCVFIRFHKFQMFKRAVTFSRRSHSLATRDALSAGRSAAVLVYLGLVSVVRELLTATAFNCILFLSLVCLLILFCILFLSLSAYLTLSYLVSYVTLPCLIH